MPGEVKKRAADIRLLDIMLLGEEFVAKSLECAEAQLGKHCLIKSCAEEKIVSIFP